MTFPFPDRMTYEGMEEFVAHVGRKAGGGRLHARDTVGIRDMERNFRVFWALRHDGWPQTRPTLRMWIKRLRELKEMT